MFNYVCSSVYLANLAKATEKYGLGEALNSTAFPAVASHAQIQHNVNSYHQIKVTLQALNCKEGWASVIPASNSLSSQRKAYAILGLSAHTAMDAFAHRSYGKENGIWKKVNEMVNVSSSGNISNGDNKNIIPHRWEVAKQVAFTILDRYYQNGIIDATAFYKPKDYPDENIDFLMGNFDFYSKSNSNSLTQSQMDYFSERNKYEEPDNKP